jgi:hypothetical protein
MAIIRRRLILIEGNPDFLIKDGGQYILYNYLKIIKSKILYVLETFVSVSVSVSASFIMIVNIYIYMKRVPVP